MGSLPYGLQPHLIGGGQVVETGPHGLRLELPRLRTGYADAQVDDGKGRRRAEFRWAAPLQLKLRARASVAHPPGTLGFGFWNDPFGVSLGGAGGTQKLPASPQAAWFFYGAPPNDFSFAPEGVGHGWKAACLRAAHLPAALLVGGGAAALGLSYLPFIRAPVIRLAKRLVRAAEAALSAPLDEWHDYQLTWEADSVRFELDGQRVLEAPIRLSSPLCFVAWIDNQYAVLSERSGIRFGVVRTTAPAWLELQDLEIHGPGVPEG